MIKMKRVFIWLVVLVFVVSLSLVSISCKTSTTTTAAASETTTAVETTAASETTINEKSFAGQTIGVLTAPSLQSQEFFDLFTEKTGIIVNVIETPQDWEQQKQMITTYTMQGAEGVDVMALASYTFKPLANQGYYLPLDDLFTAEDLADWPTDVVNRECRTVDGTLYEVPAFLGTMAWMVNKSLLDEAGVTVPTTWEELREAAKKLTKSDGSQYGISISGMTGGHLLNEMLLFVNQAGGDLSNTQDPKTIEGLKFLYDLVVTDKSVPPEMVTEKNCQDIGAEFIAKKTAIIIDWFGCITGVDMPMEGFDKTNMIFVPAFKGAVTDGFPSGTWTYAISKFSKNPDAAKEFIKYSMSLDGQIANKSSNPSIGKAYADLSKLANPEAAAAQQLYVANATSRLFAGDYTSELEGTCDIDFNSALAGTISFEDALAAIQQKIDAVVK